MICMLYVVSYLLYVLCMSWAGRRLYYGPEGNMLWAGRRYDCVMDRKVGVGKAGRFTQQGRKSPETHGPEGQGLERRMCVSCILGNSLSIYAYSCCVCVSGTSEDRGKAPA